MEFRVSDRLNKIEKYAFAEVDNEVAKLKSLGITPIDFGVGDPKEPTPEIVRSSIKKAVDKRKSSGYPSYIGTEEFRSEIANWCKKRFNISLDINKEITSTIGSKEGVFNFPEAIINPGDYVVVPNPYYPPYVSGTLFAEGNVFYLPLLKENNFLMDLSKIPKEIVKKTKILWINYPNNPTGAVADKEFFKEVIDFGKDNNIIIASDECYTELYFGKKPSSILEYSREGIIVFQSLSKRSAMTCYRVGWAMGDEKIISAFKILKTSIDSGTATIIQDAAISALKDEKHVIKMRESYKLKKDLLIEAFTKTGLENCSPEGAMYIWQTTPKGLSSVEFAKKLLQKEFSMVVTPGELISKTCNNLNPGKNYVRFALVPTVPEIKESAKRIVKYLKI